MSFCLGGGSGCKNVLLEIALLDKIFKILAERLTLRSLVPLVVVEGTIVSCFRASRVARVCLRVLHPGLTFDDFEDVLNREFQQSEVVRYLVSSRLALLRVPERLLLVSTFPVTLEVNGGVSVQQLQFCPAVTAVERWVGGAFHCLLQLDVWLGSI